MGSEYRGGAPPCGLHDEQAPGLRDGGHGIRDDALLQVEVVPVQNKTPNIPLGQVP